MREWIGILLLALLCGCETIVDLDIPGELPIQACSNIAFFSR